MSADNIIYVQKKYRYYHVWEQSASMDPDYKIGHRHIRFEHRENALIAAHDLNKEIYTEYGVNEI